MKFSDLKDGMIVYDMHTYRMGNTTQRTYGVWQIYIQKVEPETQTVIASWNGNPFTRFYASTYRKWRKTEPVLVKTGIFGRRPETREEKKQRKAKEATIV